MNKGDISLEVELSPSFSTCFVAIHEENIPHSINV